MLVNKISCINSGCISCSPLMYMIYIYIINLQLFAKKIRLFFVERTEASSTEYPCIYPSYFPSITMQHVSTIHCICVTFVLCTALLYMKSIHKSVFWIKSFCKTILLKLFEQKFLPQLFAWKKLYITIKAYMAVVSNSLTYSIEHNVLYAYTVCYFNFNYNVHFSLL